MKRKRKRKRPLHIILADLAEQHGMYAVDLLKFPDELGRFAKDFKQHHAVQADQYNKDQLQKLIEKHGANKRIDREAEFDKRFGTQQQPKERKEKPKENKSSRRTVFGHSLTAIVRWMGSDAWTKEEALLYFEKAGIPIAPNTIGIQLRNKENKPAAELTESQVNHIYEVLES